MGFILKWLSGPVGVWIVVALAVVIGGLSLTSYAMYQRGERYQVERDEARRERAALLAAAESKDRTITDLQASLKVWQALSEDNAAASAAAGNRATAYETELAGARERIRKLTEQDHGKPDCEAMLELDLSAVCPGHSAKVRAWAK